MRRLASLAVTISIAAVGCKTGVLPDPNDPNEAGVQKPEVLRRSLTGGSMALMERRQKGEINDDQFKILIAKYANELLGGLRIDRIDPSLAWQYAEVLRTAKRYKQAEEVLRIAVTNAKERKDSDRFVNDSLRLADALAHLDRVDEAIPIARSTFTVEPRGKAPILIAILLEVVPAGRGKGKDKELADLLVDAIDQSRKTVVDPKTEAGALFLAARPHHVDNAWKAAIEMYSESGHKDLAASTSKKALAEDEATLRL